MAAWWVSEPYINLRIEDEPLWYEPAVGAPITLHLSYRQRGCPPEPSAIFGVGTNWSLSFRTYLIAAGGNKYRLHRGGAGFMDYELGTPHFDDGSLLTGTNGLALERTDGARLSFATQFTFSGITFYFLTTQSDPYGNTLGYNYVNTNNYIRLLNVRDGDGRLTQFYYTNAIYTNLITQVVDPYGRTARMEYNSDGMLARIVDVQGLASGFSYGTNKTWITSMITPYGTNYFLHGGIDAESIGFTSDAGVANRFIQITLPTGGKHLYLYRQNLGDLTPWTYTVPTTDPFTNMLETVAYNVRNSFHWNPLQYAGLNTNTVDTFGADQYAIGHLKHWLLGLGGSNACVMALERWPSPNGLTPGQAIFYDYPGKTSADLPGANSSPVLVAQIMPNGESRVTSMSFNRRGYPTQVVSSYSVENGSVGWRTTSFAYATNGIDLVQEIGPDLERVRSNYYGSAPHLPMAIYDAKNQQTLLGYNGYGQLTQRVDSAGLTTAYLYGASGDASNRLERIIELEISSTNSFAYYPNGLLYYHTDARGLTTTNFWDDLQRLTGVLYPDGTTISNRYDKLDVIAAKDRMNQWTYASYNEARQPTYVTNANLVVTRYDYCTCGALESIRGALGTADEQLISYGYDYQGNQTYSYGPDGTITNWYNSLGQVYYVGRPDGYRSIGYNHQGLQCSVTNSYGLEQLVVFDSHDRPVRMTDANGVTTTNAYDVLDRLTAQSTWAGSNFFGHSARGLVAYTNAMGHTNFFAYDAARRMTFATNANGELLRFTNNAAGDMVALVDGKNQATRWVYNQYGQVSNKLDQAGVEVLRFHYDPEGRLTNRLSAAKGNTRYYYDAVGNLTYVDYPTSPDITLYYDKLDRLTNMLDAVGSTKYGYTAGGLLASEDGPFASDTVTNGYMNGMRTSLGLQQPAGFWTNRFQYDLGGRLTNVTSPAGSFVYLLGATASASPLASRVTLPNTSINTNLYDPLARLTATYLKTSGGTLRDKAEYAYNALSQRRTFTNGSGESVVYSYDKIGQLKIADSSLNASDRGYTYDTAWNLGYRTNNVTLEAFTVDGRNQLTNTPYGSGTFDANGNTLSSAGGSRIYAYDDENQLISLSITNSGTEAYYTEFVYDGLQRLRKRLEWYYPAAAGTNPPEGLLSLDEEMVTDSAPTSGWLFVSETRYIYDGRRVIQERDGNNTPTVSYTRGSDLSGSLGGAGGIGGLLARSHGYSAGSGAWSTHNYYHTDGNGNVTCLIDGSQAISAAYRYGPFGEILGQSGALANANVYRFSSKEFHATSGLSYYLYRFYDPIVQRWINRDPINERGGINLYGFVGNDPINEIDPFGLWTTDIHNQLIDAAFPNLTPGARQILKDASAEVDSLIPGQLSKNSHTHAMSQRGESAEEAALKWSKYLTDQQDKARNALHQGKVLCGHPGPVIVSDLDKAMSEFGRGLHALSDSTSPSHRGFQPWEAEHVRSHHNAEKTISPQDLQTTVDLMRHYYKTTFGTTPW